MKEPNENKMVESDNLGSKVIHVKGIVDRTRRPRRFNIPLTWDEVRRRYGTPRPPEEPEKPASSDEPIVRW